MILDRKMAKVIGQLEYCIGSNCFNYWGKRGKRIRYPVNLFTKTLDGSYGYERIEHMVWSDSFETGYDVSPRGIRSLKYKFGNNHLYVGEGIVSLMEKLEQRYGLDFNSLEEEYLRRAEK